MYNDEMLLTSLYFYKELLPFEHKITTYFENRETPILERSKKTKHVRVQQANQKIMH